MDRRSFIKSAAALPATGALAALPGIGAQAQSIEAPQWRGFEVTTKVEIAEAVGTTRLWIPLPLAVEVEYQRAFYNSWHSNASLVRVEREPRYDAAMLYAEWHGGEGTPVLQLESRFATRDRFTDFTAKPASQRPSRGELDSYLGATEYLPTDGIVRDSARKIVAAVQGDEIAKARAIYEWIVDNTFRDPKTIGCGRGDIRFMLESRYFGGKCADLNALFVGLARAVGIPARDVYGVRVADSRLGYKSLGKSGDITKAQHCRAEFYSAKYGWVPVDPADVRKVVLEEKPDGLSLDHPQVQAARKRLFGSWEMNWLAYNTAHDVRLAATQTKLPFLMYPQAETAGGRRDCYSPDSFRYRIAAREIAV
jgi:transglutaminase-like putative cysteine protease